MNNYQFIYNNYSINFLQRTFILILAIKIVRGFGAKSPFLFGMNLNRLYYVSNKNDPKFFNAIKNLNFKTLKYRC